MSDCISRQAVLELLDFYDGQNQQHFTVENLRDEVENIPSVQPQKQPCKDCISRAKAIKAIRQIHPVDTEYDCTLYDKMDVMYVLNELPPVTPQPKMGQWIENAPEYQNIDPPYICSECGNLHLRKTNYCDQCGCRMVEQQESEEA